MASKGEKTGTKDEGEAKQSPSSQEVAPPLVSMKGIMTNMYIALSLSVNFFGYYRSVYVEALGILHTGKDL